MRNIRARAIIGAGLVAYEASARTSRSNVVHRYGGVAQGQWSGVRVVHQKLCRNGVWDGDAFRKG